MNLNNTATAVGTYNEISTSLTSNVSVVNMISGLSMTKSADKVNWADGYLTYTVTINNQSTETYVAPVITDIIDTTLVDFVDGSVMSCCNRFSIFLYFRNSYFIRNIN